MALPRHASRKFAFLPRTSFLLAMAGVLFLAGCAKALKVSDPQVKAIQDMLEANLPARSPEGTVSQFLEMRGYARQASGKPGTVVAMIPYVDPDRRQTVTARVTFYFDANGKLNTYEIVRAPFGPAPQ